MLKVWGSVLLNFLVMTFRVTIQSQNNNNNNTSRWQCFWTCEKTASWKAETPSTLFGTVLKDPTAETQPLSSRKLVQTRGNPKLLSSSIHWGQYIEDRSLSAWTEDWEWWGGEKVRKRARIYREKHSYRASYNGPIHPSKFTSELPWKLLVPVSFRCWLALRIVLQSINTMNWVTLTTSLSKHCSPSNTMEAVPNSG